VTGAGRGIGRAIAHRLAAGGARLVVNDLDENAAEKVAGEVGGLAVPGDAAGEAGVQALVGAATEHLGDIDVYCANAGVATEGGPEAPEDAWALSWDVNVMAHVRASRLLVPRWLERGSGRFVATVSAAGLLTMLGSAPYSASKHAALAYAEWLRATYAHRGLIVQALCPQGVRTDMLTRGNDSGSGSAALLAEGALPPSEVADLVAASLDGTGFLILPHPEVEGYYRLRASDPDRWLGGMNKLQRGFEQRAGS